MPDLQECRLLRTRQAAAYVGISERTLWTLGSSGQIRQVRFDTGGRSSVRYDLRDLDDWIESKKMGGQPR